MFKSFINRDLKLEKSIARILFNNSLKISTAESCTGGLLSSRLTDISGSSVYTALNYVTYSNEAKNKVLNVPMKIINEYGAVSRECARDMAEGLYDVSNSDIVVCTTGIAGPTGGSENKPVGLLYVAIKNQMNIEVKEYKLNPKLQRVDMKYEFTQCTLTQLLEFLNENYLSN